MRKTLEIFKVAFLYVGSLVGAGFASGNEIRLYFGGSDIFSVLLSALFCGGTCCLFLAVGKNVTFGKIKKVLDLVFAVVSIISAGVMLASLNELSGAIPTIIISLTCIVIVYVTSNGAKKFCLFAVPVIMFLITLVFFNRDNYSFAGKFTPVSSITYATMNLFFEFGLMYEQGKNLSSKQSIFVGLIVFLSTFILLFVMRCIIDGADSSLPFVQSAVRLGLGFTATVTMYLAISSTLVGCFTLAKNYFSFMPSSVAGACIACLSLTLATINFDKMVSTVYPIISFLGILLVMLSMLFITIYYLKKYKVKNLIKNN